MFPQRESVVERRLRNATGEFDAFVTAIRRHPPRYKNQMDNTELLYVLEHENVVYIDAVRNIATTLIEKMRGSCHLFKTAELFGIEPYWVAAIMQKQVHGLGLWEKLPKRGILALL
jgi:hypothetical protein